MTLSAAPLKGLLLVGAAALALQACTSRGAQDQSQLAKACEVIACSCVPKQHALFSTEEKQPVLWRSDGTAYCPEDAYLVRDTSKYAGWPGW